MEKIAVLTTGGTIGSTISGAAKSVTGTQQRLKEEIASLCERNGLEIEEIVEVFNKNSEDVEPRDWGTLLAATNRVVRQGIRRIVVTHGTDTLPYTATALALFFSRPNEARICITGSYLSLDDPDSDVGLSLLAALECVSSDALTPNVYVAFRDSHKNKNAIVIPAFDLKPMDFDDLFFRPLYGRRVAGYGQGAGASRGNFRAVAARYEEFRNTSFPHLPGPLPSESAIEAASGRVLLGAVCPGMKIGEVADFIRSKDALVLSLYHSGTAPTGDQEGGLLQFLKNNRGKIPVFMAGFPAKHLKTPYASTLRLIEAGAGVYRDLQAFQIYTMLVLGLAQGLSARDVWDLLEPWRFKI